MYHLSSGKQDLEEFEEEQKDFKFEDLDKIGNFSDDMSENDVFKTLGRLRKILFNLERVHPNDDKE